MPSGGLEQRPQMLGARPANGCEIRQTRMFVEIVDRAMERPPKLIDHRDRAQAVAAQIEEIVLAGDEAARQVLRPHLRDRARSMPSRGCGPLEAAARQLRGKPALRSATSPQQRRPIHLAGDIHRDGRYADHGRRQHVRRQRGRR
jgi:hypothetical protein